ncbi:MAG TPA: protein kinase [Gemmatimonadaceae bacterium]
MAGHRSSESWVQLASLIDVLLDAAPERRGALILELSAGDPARQADLERLLVECDVEPVLFSRSAAEQFVGMFDDDVARFPDALAERYRLTETLGRGGMATVYLARDLKHAREVAVKVLHPLVASVLGADRFLREIGMAAQLHHPHIVPLFDSGNEDGSLYYVMPYEAGLSLRQRLARDGQLPVEDVIVILRDVCDALAYAHERGIVHRDVKPDNVLLSGRHAMLADFGVARAATEAAASASGTGAGVTVGTPAYMAPEQVAADPHVDHRADIYSVGVLAYELLAGRLPFEDDGWRDAPSHFVAEPPSLTTHRPDVPASLEALVMKCLQKRAVDRWQSADEMVRQLETLAGAVSRSRAALHTPTRRTRQAAATIGIVAAALIAAAVVRQRGARGDAWRSRWANARIERLTDFPGSEVDAAISADGRSVVFLADRDSVFDAFVTRVGSEQFLNLTGGRYPQLFNEDVRNVGFTADAAHVWFRVAEIAAPASVSLVPATGGDARPFLNAAVMAVWSPDGKKVAYHETAGDPVYVADRDGSNARRIYVAEPGVHCHDLAWSPDGRFLYFAKGLPPDAMDVWRIPSNGGAAERITRHDSRVAYPALLDDRTLVYTATADDGTGPWLYTMDLNDRVAHRVSTGVEHYVSVSASAQRAGQPWRLVATVSNPEVRLWSVPIATGVAGEAIASQVALPTARSAAPRFGHDASLFYLASLGGADGLWRLSGGHARELWKSSQGAVVGAAAESPDGRRVCFPVRRNARSTLYCVAADGTGARVMAEGLDVRGAASWSPDGRWLAVAAREGPGTRVFKVPVGGGAPVRLVDSVSSNPVWSRDGAFILYSGTPRARSVSVRAVTPDGRPHPLPPLAVDRLGDSYRFLPDGKSLVVKLGGFRRQDFWSFDLATGRRRPLTALKPGESVQRFDVSPDGKRILFERMRENSDVVLIELPPG